MEGFLFVCFLMLMGLFFTMLWLGLTVGLFCAFYDFHWSMGFIIGGIVCSVLGLFLFQYWNWVINLKVFLAITS